MRGNACNFCRPLQDVESSQMADLRLIAIDIDGTLLDPKFQVSEANLRALGRAHQSGIEIALATGRRHDFALPVAQSLGFPVTLISSNGAVTRSSAGELFHLDLLPLETARELLAHMSEFRHHLVVTFDRTQKGALVLETTDELTLSIKRWIEKNIQYIEFVIPIEKALTEAPIQAMYCGTVGRMHAAENRLLANPGLRARVTALKTQYDERDLCIMDILNANCSKGHALRRWTESHGIPRESVMAIGDNFNDVEMLEFAGIPVIMGNATEELKSNGWMVTLGNDQSGVAHAVEQYLDGDG
jgi:Cof subfamily protein (haloacid dehalogenase superfamily)